MSENRSLLDATANSEDELFRILSRPSIYEMHRIYTDWIRKHHLWSNEDRRKLFNDNDWGVIEFTSNLRKNGLTYPHD